MRYYLRRAGGTDSRDRTRDGGLTSGVETARPEKHDHGEDRPERLQKYLARMGFGSRRAVESWVIQGRVTVDGQVATVGDKVRAGQAITLDGKPLQILSRGVDACRVLLYYKPEGEVTTRSDPEGRPTVFDKLPRMRNARWVAVGRLDFNTQGLLLFTTDGELAHRLMHPSSEIEREYAVRVLGEVTPEMMKRLTQGVDLDGELARFDSVADAGGEGVNHWYKVILREGRHREVRRLWDAVGVTVSRLIRVRYGPMTLPRGLHAGQNRALEPEEIDQLRVSAGLTPLTREMTASAERPHDAPVVAPGGPRYPANPPGRHGGSRPPR